MKLIEPWNAVRLCSGFSQPPCKGPFNTICALPCDGLYLFSAFTAPFGETPVATATKPWLENVRRTGHPQQLQKLPICGKSWSGVGHMGGSYMGPATPLLGKKQKFLLGRRGNGPSSALGLSSIIPDPVQQIKWTAAYKILGQELLRKHGFDAEESWNAILTKRQYLGHWVRSYDRCWPPSMIDETIGFLCAISVILDSVKLPNRSVPHLNIPTLGGICIVYMKDRRSFVVFYILDQILNRQLNFYTEYYKRVECLKHESR